MRRIAFSLCLCVPLFCSTGAFALSTSPEIESHIQKGLDNIYRLDFFAAQSEFEKIVQLAPEEPIGYFFLSGLCWWRLTENYEFSSETQALEDFFDRSMQLTIEKAEKKQKLSEFKAESFFFIGGVYGLKARIHVLKKRWVRAYFAGAKACRYLQKAVEMNPELYDAYLGLGICDYYNAALPPILGIPSLLFVRGDKERGLRKLGLVIEKGRYSVVESMIFLANIYAKYESNKEKALKWARALESRYPESPYFRCLEVAAQFARRDWSATVTAGQDYLKRALPSPGLGLCGSNHSPFVLVVMGSAELAGSNFSGALQWLDRCIADNPTSRGGWVSWCYLRRGEAYDMLGKRHEAIRDYRSVLERSDAWGAHGKARRFLRSPCTRPEVMEDMHF